MIRKRTPKQIMTELNHAYINFEVTHQRPYYVALKPNAVLIHPADYAELRASEDWPQYIQRDQSGGDTILGLRPIITSSAQKPLPCLL